jgi:glycosidase
MLWGADQNTDLLAHFQHLGRLRRDSLALRRGQRKTVLADKEVLAYEREAAGETVLVALNFSERPQRRELAGHAVELEPLGSVVLGAGMSSSVG